MKRFYPGLFQFLFFAMASVLTLKAGAQITVTTTLPSNYLYNSATADGAIVFGVKNTTASNITITDVANYVQAGFSGTLTLWYHTTVTGAPTAINTTNGWVNAGTATVTNNPTAGITPLFTGLTITLPANTTYRFAISGPPFSPYYAPALTTPNFHTGSGLEIYTQDNPNSPGYGGAFPGPPGNTPRGFIGSVTFSPTAACTTPPSPGIAKSNRARVCAGQNFTLDLYNNSIGTGQTYQWETSPNNSTWTPLGTPSNTPVLTTTHSASTYYRVAVTCGGNTQYSQSVLVNFGPLSGTYTINSTLPSSATNFQSFTEAIQNLVCVSGPVVFNVAAGSGPYTEQIAINSVSGASATNTITFNGNGATLQYNPIAGLRHIIALDGADFITIKKLNIISQNATYGWGVHLANGANNNTIDSCTIDLSAVTSTTVDNSAGIVVANSITDLNADGNANNNTISANTIIGGYQGIIINGAATALNATNNVITRNTIQDFYANGIELTENDGTVVSFNNIHRANRVTVTSFAGIEAGIGNRNLTIDANRIHDTHTSATTQTGLAYGVYITGADAPAGSENKVTNNLVYNFNSGSGTQYGIYNIGSDGVRYYHNTVVLNNAASTAGTTRGFYQTTAASNIEFRNNIVYVTRGGTGTKHAVYFGTTTSSIVSNNNVLYVNATGSTVGIGSFGTANSATLAAWQTANSNAYDQQSVDVDPQFAAPASGNFYPNNNAIATIGANVGVTTDILNAPRTVTSPTPGAYEINNGACTNPPNPGTTTASPSTPICIGTTVNLDVTGHSTGTGQTYQWQSASASGGPYTNFGSVQTNTSTSVNPTATTWYRLAVTCSGNTQYSVPVQVVMNPAFPGGTYTINSAVVTGGTNFQSFTDAVNALNCGIAGPVVFNVVAGSGPYVEQISIPEIGGASAINTITFNGNNDTIKFNAVTGARHIIQLNGADYIRIKKLNILSTNATYGWGVHLLAGANNNLIDSSTIDMSAVTSTTVDNSAGIVVAGSSSDLNADGNANNNTFSNNIIIGGYQGIIINGTATGLNATGNIITKNTIQDFYANGIELIDNDGTQISFNDINRATRVAVTGFEGIEVGVGNRNLLINANRIHDSHTSASTQTGLAYGIFITGSDAPAGSENRVTNNLIYNFNSASGTQYGIYNAGSDGVRYYHNTVALTNTASTAGTTKGFYQTTAASNIEFKNNIIYITRGGTGLKHTIDFNTTTSVIVSNNNVLYINSAAGTNNIGAFGATDYTTLATWQTANSNAYDQQSVNADPLFASPATGNFYPNNTSIATVGANVGVATDILGLNRNLTTPTPGAYEIVISVNSDMGALDLLTPVQKACYSNAETVTVRIKNYSASTHNFVTNPVTVNASVAGTNPTIFTPVIINTGSLPSGDTLNVVITNSYNMTAAGTYTFNASTTVTGDANATNNAMPATVRTVVALSAGAVSSNPPSYCVTGGIPALSTAGSGGGTLQWQQSVSATGPWVNVGSNLTTYSPAAAITDTMFYRVIATCNANNDTSNVVSVELNNPIISSTTPGVRCGPGTVTLGASGLGGATFNWYASATGGIPIATGASYTTPVINSTTTYYVSATTGGNTENMPSPTAGTSMFHTNTVGWGLRFTVNSPVTINSVVMYPTNTTAGAASLQIKITDLADVVLFTGPLYNFTVGTSISAHTVPVNITLQPGNYKMQMTSTGINNLVRESSGVTFPYTSLSNAVSITAGANGAGTAQTTTAYYWFYNWQISTGCESPRQAVVATVNTAPSFDVTNDVTVCNNAITPITVNSPLANFNTYTWTPAAGLFTDAAATTPYVAGTSATTLYARTATPGTYTFYATANNTTTTCQNIDSVKVTVLPAAISVIPSSDRLCVSGTTTLNLSPNPSTFGAATYQWSSSTNNVAYTPISGATAPSYTTPTINTTTYYKVDIKNSAGQVCLSPYDTVVVSNPAILTTTPAALCGPGVMTLAATANAGSTINWYTAPIGGTLVGTGPSFTTPNLTTTTTYYAAAFTGGGNVNVGILVAEFPICGTPVTSATTDQSLRFTTTKPLTINSAYILPTATSVTVALRAQGSTTNIVTQTFTFTSGQLGQPQQINLGWSVPSPGNYQLVNTSGGIWRTTVLACGYPFNSPGGSMSITGSATSSTGTPNTTTYTGFYQLNISEGCESPRTPVVAQVSSNTAITQQPVNISTCAGASINLVVGASGANLVYQWRKGGVNIANSNNDTLTINPVNIADAGNYDVVITGLCGGAVTSTVATVNVAAGNTWLGTVSSDWNTAANWCGGVPTATSDVTIFAGTPYQPVVNANIAHVRNLTISTGALVTMNPSATMNIHGDFVNNGTFNAANAFVFFMGTANQNISGMTVGNVVVNGAGITLTGTMTVNQAFTLTNGNVTLGINNLTVNGSVSGTVNSHIVTNSTGSVVSRNINNTPVTVPVGPSAASYNPVIINNGGGRDYSVRVSTGLSPTINNPSRAVNRTWNVTASTPPGAPVSITFQYEDTHMNVPGVATNNMEVGVHNGATWTVVTPSVTPSGSPTSRQVISTTTQFGPMAVANIGGISWITSAPTVDPTISSVKLLPNLVENVAVLRVMAVRTAKIRWNVIDAQGRIVMSFDRSVLQGQNDIPLQLQQLAGGNYTLSGVTDKGVTSVIRFVKQ